VQSLIIIEKNIKSTQFQRRQSVILAPFAPRRNSDAGSVANCHIILHVLRRASVTLTIRAINSYERNCGIVTLNV